MASFNHRVGKRVDENVTFYKYSLTERFNRRGLFRGWDLSWVPPEHESCDSLLSHVRYTQIHIQSPFVDSIPLNKVCPVSLGTQKQTQLSCFNGYSKRTWTSILHLRNYQFVYLNISCRYFVCFTLLVRNQGWKALFRLIWTRKLWNNFEPRALFTLIITVTLDSAAILLTVGAIIVVNEVQKSFKINAAWNVTFCLRNGKDCVKFCALEKIRE